MNLPLFSSLVLPVSLLVCGVAHAQNGAGTFEAVADFGANPGTLHMYRYVPPGAPADAPLVVAFHACSETASDYRKAGWEPLADEFGFYVLYPEQDPANNALRCFNWAGEYGDPTNLRRGEGENLSVRNMVQRMQDDHAIDAGRIFGTGQSGGGAMVALMMATYPDVFSGGGIIAGIGYNCTTNFNQVSTCLNPGIPRDAAAWGDAVRDAVPDHDGPWPKLAVMHGTADGTVNPANLTELVKQWTNVHGGDQEAEETENGQGFVHKTYEGAAAGASVVESWELQGQGHGVFVDPANGCGVAGPYFLSANFCSSRVLADFFGLTGAQGGEGGAGGDGGGGGGGGDETPPTVTLTAPANGSTVSGTVTITAEATDDVGVASVEFFANARSLGMVGAAPFEFQWETSVVPNGIWDLKVVARDAAGNEADDSGTKVTVTGGIEDMTAPTVSIVSPTAGAQLLGVVPITFDAQDDFAVASVTLKVDGVSAGLTDAAPYAINWDTTDVPFGMHTLTAEATDATGNVGISAEVIVEVIALIEPEAAFTSPAPNGTLSGIASIDVSATHPVKVTQVILFLAGEAGEQALGTDRAPPFNFLWDTRLMPNGPYHLIARAFEPAGNIGVAELDVVISNSDEPEPDGGVGSGGTGGSGSDGAGGVATTGETGSREIGRKRWGCTTAPGVAGFPNGLSGLFFLMSPALLALARRRRRS